MIGDVKTDSVTVWVGIEAKYKEDKLPSESLDLYPTTAQVTYFPVDDPTNINSIPYPLPLQVVRCGEGEHKNLAYEGTRLPLVGLEPDTQYS
ncbi:MAG: hypothetical protein ACJA0H_000458 [Francisellaceae bacterium]|jgi:hypothetical protein